MIEMSICNQNPLEINEVVSEFEAQNKLQNPLKENPFGSQTKFPGQKSDLYPSNWSTLIRNYIFQGKTKQALLIYTRNRGIGSLGLGAIPSALKACAALSMLSLGQSLHAESIKGGVEVDVIVGTALVDMYGKCSGVIDSRKLFDNMPERNVRTWNAIIGGYMRVGDLNSATVLFEEMPMRTSVTWYQMIDGFAKNGNVVIARQFFDRMPEGLRTVVTWTTIVDGYTSRGEMEATKEVFEMMPKRNFSVWLSMISGYIFQRKTKQALLMYTRNRRFSSLVLGAIPLGLKAFAALSMLSLGQSLHAESIKGGAEVDVIVGTALVDMYGKCGGVIDSKKLFDNMPERNVRTWNAVIGVNRGDRSVFFCS